MARSLIDGGGPTPVSTKYTPKSTSSNRVLSSSGLSAAELDRLKAQAAARPLGQQLSGAHGGIPTSHGLAPLTSIGTSTATSAARLTPAAASVGGGGGGGGGGGYGGGGGGGGYGGGGGGGGGAAGPTQASFDAYMAAMQRLLSQGTPVQAMKHPLTGKINPAMNADIAAAQAAFRGIPQQTNNPFAGMQFQAPTLSPSLQRFIESQGGDVGAYQNQVAASNVGLQSGAADWNNLAQVLGGNVTAAQQDFRSANDMQLQAILSALRGQGTEMNAAVAMQQAQFDQQARQQQAALEAARREALAQALSTGLQYGFTPPKGM